VCAPNCLGDDALDLAFEAGGRAAWDAVTVDHVGIDGTTTIVVILVQRGIR
jgi:hypothetical protein